MKKLLNKSGTIFIIFAVYFCLITFFYYQKVGAFGCFDDCFNFMGGYLLVKGSQIYSGFFFNHQPLMAYISFAIQKIFQPQTLYQLVLYHRLFLFGFSFLMGNLLIFRFRWLGLGFLLVYESTKFYIFGDRFLAESFIAYPMTYLLGLVLIKFSKGKLKPYDYIISGVFTWFVIFMREPYIPIATALYIFILIKNDNFRFKIISILTFGFLALATLISIPLRDYILNIVVYNQKITISEVSSTGGFAINLLKSLFYPVYVIISSGKNLLWIIFLVIDLVFIASLINLVKKHQLKLTLLIILFLGLSNIRPETPGIMYFSSFHMVVWYSLLIFTTLFIIKNIQKNTKMIFLLILPIFLVVIYSLLSNESFTRNDTNKTTEFNNGYANEFAYGTVVKQLSKPSDTVFLEKKDDLIYWVSGLNSSYKYSLYTSFMPFIEKYSQERLSMFKNNPPDFYYDACLKNKEKLPMQTDSQYVRILLNQKPSCLLVKKTKLKKISKEQWNSVMPLGFSLALKT